MISVEEWICATTTKNVTRETNLIQLIDLCICATTTTKNVTREKDFLIQLPLAQIDEYWAKSGKYANVAKNGWHSVSRQLNWVALLSKL